MSPRESGASVLGPQQSESGAPTRPRRLNIVARGGGARRLDAQRCASRFLAVRSLKAPWSLNSATREALEIGAAQLLEQRRTPHTRANERARASSEVASPAVQQCKCYASPAGNKTPSIEKLASVLHPLVCFFEHEPSKGRPRRANPHKGRRDEYGRKPNSSPRAALWQERAARRSGAAAAE